MKYEIRNSKNEVIVYVSKDEGSAVNPQWRADLALERLEKAGGKGRYTIVEVEGN